MDPLQLLRIAELAIGLIKAATSGTEAGKVVANIAALEEIASRVAQQYASMAGKPLDLSLLTHEELIP